MIAYLEYTKGSREKPKCIEWYYESGADEESEVECQFFKGESIYKKARKQGTTSTSTKPYNFNFTPYPDFLESMDKKFPELSKRRELVIYLTNWLSAAIFTNGGGKEVRSSCIYTTCRMAYRERYALAPGHYFLSLCQATNTCLYGSS